MKSASRASCALGQMRIVTPSADRAGRSIRPWIEWRPAPSNRADAACPLDAPESSGIAGSFASANRWRARYAARGAACARERFIPPCSRDVGLRLARDDRPARRACRYSAKNVALILRRTNVLALSACCPRTRKSAPNHTDFPGGAARPVVSLPRQKHQQVSRFLGIREKRLARRAHLCTHGQATGKVNGLARPRGYRKVRWDFSRADPVPETTFHHRQPASGSVL